MNGGVPAGYEVDFVFRQLGDLFFVGRNRRLKLFDPPVPHVVKERNHADPMWR
jgi:hypothetical protein